MGDGWTEKMCPGSGMKGWDEKKCERKQEGSELLKNGWKERDREWGQVGRDGWIKWGDNWVDEGDIDGESV